MEFKDADVIIGEKLKKARIEKRASMQDIANIIGVSRQCYYQYEHGIISMPEDKCKLACKFVDIEYHELIKHTLEEMISKYKV